MQWRLWQKAKASRRLWLPWAALVASLLLVNLLWRAEGYRRWHRLIADAKARGEPAGPEDFDPGPEVPEGENAVASLLWAEDHIEGEQTIPSVVERIRDQIPLPMSITPADLEGHLDVVEPIVREHAPVLEKIRLARRQRQVHWDVRLRPPLQKAVRESGSALMKTISLLEFVLLYDQASGDDGQLVERLRDLLRVQEIAATAPVDYYGYRDTESLNFEAVAVIERTGARMRIAAAPALPGGFRAATREQVSDLISDLLNESPMRRHAARSLFCQRMVDLEWLAKSDSHPLSEIWGLGPAAWFSAIRMGRDDGLTATAIKAPSWPSALASRPESDRRRRSFFEAVYRLGGRDYASNDFAIRRFYQALAARRIAALMLAIRLWREDHQGNLPATLDALVPRYLPSVPADPLAADGRAISYNPRARPPVVYSVNVNGTDDGGRLPTSGRTPWQSLDASFSLQGEQLPPPLTQPSTQAQNHN